MQSISLYIHIPWCERKCPYCDFNSHPKESSFDESNYVLALVKDIQYSSLLLENKKISSIFFGGGTPSLFQPASFDKILTAINSHSKLSSDTEITLEANPGSFEKEKFVEFKSAGINRLSIGVQSYADEFLSKLGRIHSARDAIKAVEHAMDIGFNQVNTDIMYGLPGQSLKQCLRDLNNAIAIQADHFSWYQLTLEPNTYFYKNPPSLPQHDLLWDMQTQGFELLEQHEYKQYEVSAYSKSVQCQHNLNYWQFGDYLGIGAGAHGKISRFSPFAINRTLKKKHPREYIKHAGTNENEQIESISDPRTLIFEFMLNGLRLNQGVSFELFEQNTQLEKDELIKSSEKALQQELVEHDDEIIRTTEHGKKFLNDAVMTYLP